MAGFNGKPSATLDSRGKVLATQMPSSVNTGLIINGLGDSMTARSLYQPTNSSVVNIPAWAPGTNYTANKSVVINGGLVYLCVTTGTSAGSGGPTGTGNSNIVDNTAQWRFLYPFTQKIGTSWLTWMEAFSGGRLTWRMSDGFAGYQYGITRIVVINGGSNYTAPTLDLTAQNGAAATLQVTNGVITGVTVTAPGYGCVAGNNYTINDSTGSGAVLSICGNPSGTFATPGAWTQDVLYNYLPDAIASNVDIFVVSCGTNDVSNNVSYATITGNLRAIWEALIAAGKKAVIVPLPPTSYSQTTNQIILRQRVNKFIRAYYRKESWANPLGYQVSMADFTPLWSDGTSATNGVVGGTSAAYPALTGEGLHQATRGAQLAAITIMQSIKADFGIDGFTWPPHQYGYGDGYDPVVNPGGNCLEGNAWQASTAYVLGSKVSNNNNVYYCVTAGVSASSGGPTTGGTNITDGTAAWTYAGNSAGVSVFAGGTGGTQQAASGITYSGSMAKSWKITRNSGTASGTVKQQIENPWSNGKVGQRQVTSFSLGGGGATEEWIIYIPGLTLAGLGLVAADFGSSLYYMETEIEVSGAANLTLLYAKMIDNASQTQASVGNTNNSYSGSLNDVLFSAGEPVEWPNNGKILLRTEPIQIPSWMTGATGLVTSLTIGFNASGAANSARATIKQNYVAIKKYGVG